MNSLNKLDTEVIMALCSVLGKYVKEKPQHRWGLCAWLDDQALMDRLPAKNYYQIVHEYRRERAAGPISDYVDDEQGPAPKRIAFARQFLKALKAQLPKPDPRINLRKASLQRIFEFALRHIREQGRGALNTSGACVYRAQDGAKCAVGAMLSDEDMALFGISEGITVVNYRARFKAIVPARRKLDLLQSLQEAHDSYASSTNFLPLFETRMKDVAAAYGLKYKPPGTTLRA